MLTDRDINLLVFGLTALLALVGLWQSWSIQRIKKRREAESKAQCAAFVRDAEQAREICVELVATRAKRLAAGQ